MIQRICGVAAILVAVGGANVGAVRAQDARSSRDTSVAAATPSRGGGPASISGTSPSEQPTPPVAEAIAQPSPPTPPVATDPTNTNGLSGIPLLAYSPETHVAFGGFGVYFFRFGDSPPESRPSYLAAAAMYTTRLQTLADVYPDFWIDDERFHLASVINVRDFPDSFFGIGSNTRAEDEERYRFQSVRDQIDFTVRVAGRLYAGVRQELQWYHVADPVPGGVLAQRTVLGAEGGWRSGAGLLLSWDTRDSALSARRGGYYHASLTTYQPALGSEWAYTRLNVDLRQFVPLGADHTLALQLYADLNAGDVPFQHLALLGGAHRLRGHFEGRFRDKNYVLGQAEYRTPIFLWRFGLAAFAAAGAVAPSLDAFDPAELKWAVGGGVRFALDLRERIHVRLDAGVGPSTWGIYVQVLEAF